MQRTLALAIFLSATAAAGTDEPLPPLPDFIVTTPIAGWTPARPGVVRALEGVLLHIVDIPGRNYTYSIAYSKSPYTVLVMVEEVENPRWLLHDVETHFERHAEQWRNRTAEEKKRLPPFSYELRTVVGGRVFFESSGGYVWTSGSNRVVQIDSARQIRKPDGTYETVELPDEFLTTYLSLLPSSVPEITLDSAYAQAWVREEFDRHFEIVEMYLLRWAAGEPAPYLGAQPPNAFVGAHLDDIEELRHKYFGGPSRAERDAAVVKKVEQMEKHGGPAAVSTYAAQQADYPAEKKRYDELKAWWDQHRSDTIRVAVP